MVMMMHQEMQGLGTKLSGCLICSTGSTLYEMKSHHLGRGTGIVNRLAVRYRFVR